jgi:hypothetical protein
MSDLEHTGMHPPTPKANSIMYNLPCEWACTRAYISPLLPLQDHTCEQGLTLLQLHVLILSIGLKNRITSYASLSRLLSIKLDEKHSADSVRGIIGRLVTRGYLQCQQAREGLLRGLRYQVVVSKVCPFLLRALCKDTDWNIHEGAQGKAQPKQTERSLSISLSMENRSARQQLEAITDQDIELHWPTLFGYGFRVTQIRQILSNLDKVGIGCDDVVQGLSHVEWSLSTGSIHDKNGNPVEKPVGWTYKTLSRQGYYQRPAGYVSPQEQVARDVAEEKKRMASTMEELHEAEFSVWSSQLTSEERIGIVRVAAGGNPFPMPDSVRLKAHFDKQIWPEIQKQHK